MCAAVLSMLRDGSMKTNKKEYMNILVELCRNEIEWVMLMVTSLKFSYQPSEPA